MKLTPAEKEARNLARKERDRAWRQRCRERRAIEADGLALIAQDHGPLIERAIAAREAHFRAAAEALAAIDAEISALRLRRERAATAYRAEEEPLGAAVEEAVHRRLAAERALEKRLDAAFPDMCGAARWFATYWRKP